MVKFKDIKEDTIIHCKTDSSNDFYFIVEKREDRFISWHLLIITLDNPNFATTRKIEIKGDLWDDSSKSDNAKVINNKDKRNLINSIMRIGKNGF